MSALHADASTCLDRWSAPDEEQERLRRDYLFHLERHDDALLRTCRPDHLTASCLVVSHDHARVLLTLHTKAGIWLQTGGHCEPDDLSLAGAAAREGREESGIAEIRLDPSPVLLSRHVVPFCGDIQPAQHLDVQFVATAPPDAEPVISDESADLRWFDYEELPKQADETVRRLVTASRQRLRETHAH